MPQTERTGSTPAMLAIVCEPTRANKAAHLMVNGKQAKQRAKEAREAKAQRLADAKRRAHERDARVRLFRAEKARHAARLTDSPAMREARVAYAQAEAERSVQGKAGRPRMQPMSNLTRDPVNALVGALQPWSGDQ